MYETINFDHLLGLEGFSDRLISTHLTLYAGYVANTNKLLDLLKKTDPGSVEYSELQRRFGWEWNGMRMHELYFKNLSKETTQINKENDFNKNIAGEFGSFENFKKNFLSIGMMRGIGWVVLYQDTATGRLLNVWINEHDAGHLTSCKPLLVMDVFEHSYMLDYGLKRADYIEAFFKSINWAEVEKRSE